jgi:hypothetical protein
MISKKTMCVTALCVMALAGCGQEEQKSAPVSQQPPAGNAGTATSTGQAAGGEVYEGTISGVISDSMCGKDHSGMGELGKDPVACTKACIGKGAKYVLVDKSGSIYQLSDQEKPQEFAGRTVSIEGHIDPAEKSIHVHSMIAQ